MAFKRLIEIVSGPEGRGALSVDSLYMSFDIEKNKTGTPNKARIKIYNLTDVSAAKMGSNRNKIIVRAGYGDENGLASIYFGDVIKSNTYKDGVNKVLEIEAYDGYKNIQEKNLSVSYSKGTKTTVILKDILTVLSYPLGNKIPATDDSYTSGFSFIGKAQDALTMVLKKIGYRWTIQNEQILIYQIGTSGAVTTGLLLTPSTGLLSIERQEQDIDSTGKGKEKSSVTGVPLYYTIKTLLFPQIIPGAYIKIESSIYNGTASVESAKITGDNFSQDFLVEAEIKGV